MPERALTLTNPTSVVAAVPYLLGFAPAECVAMLLVDGVDLRMTTRVDLPGGDVHQWARQVAGQPVLADADSAVLIGYGLAIDNPRVVTSLEALTVALEAVGVTVVDRIAVGLDTFRSLDCHDPSCCPPAGVPISEAAGDRTAAEFVLAGRSYVASRSVLADRLGPLRGLAAEQTASALAALSGNHAGSERELEESAVDVLTSAVDVLSPDHAAVLIGACADVFVRDPVLVRVLRSASPGEAGAIVQKFIQAAVRSPDAWRADVLAVVALCCWVDGDGAGAVIAAEAALEDDDAQSLAGLVRRAVAGGLPPQTWARLTSGIPMAVLRGQDRRSA